MIENSIEKRENVRYPSYANVSIKGINEGETLLKDLSITGCLVECSSYAGIEIHKKYELAVKPEKASKISEFKLIAESIWMREEGYSCQIGFNIHKSPEGRLFLRYVDYLAWRYSQGNSMTGNNTAGNT